MSSSFSSDHPPTSKPLSPIGQPPSPKFKDASVELDQGPLSWNKCQPDLFNPASIFDTITWIHVGPAGRVFGMHKGLLCYHSSYFRAVLTGPFSETAAANNTIVLADEDPEVFSRFNSWVCSSLIDEDWTFEDMVDMYIFAERRLITNLQNAIVNQLVYLCKADDIRMSIPVLNRAWSSTMRLKTFLVDAYVLAGDLSDAHGLEHDYLAAAMKRSTALLRQADTKLPEKQPWEEEIHVMKSAGLFDAVCERMHVHGTDGHGDECILAAEDRARRVRLGSRYLSPEYR